MFLAFQFSGLQKYPYVSFEPAQQVSARMGGELECGHCPGSREICKLLIQNERHFFSPTSGIYSQQHFLTTEHLSHFGIPVSLGRRFCLTQRL